MATEARPLDILPGIFKESSEYAGAGRWIDGSNVRFWKGYPERIGGSTQVADARALRPPRGIIAWRTIGGTQLIAFGHARGLHMVQSGTMYDIAGAIANGFTTLTLTVGTISGGSPGYDAGETVTTAAGGSATVVSAATSTPVLICADNGTHELAVSGISGTFLTGETVTFSGGGSGKVLEGTGSSPISLIDVAGTTTGTVTGDLSSASGTVSSVTELWTGTLTGGTSGATSTVSSYLETGNIDGGATTQWGTSTWGTGVWGGVESLYTTVTEPTTWTMCTWGEDLIACPRGGRIYTLDSSAWESASTTNVTEISNAPDNALGIFMNADNRTLIAYGAYDGSSDDPLNVRWCDEEDFTTWTASADNTAGSLRCEDGSTIIGQMEARGGHLISTDTAIYLFRYIGLPFIFSLEKIADQSSLIGPHASAELDGITYWMGPDGFYMYDGSVAPLPCDVHQYIFSRLNLVQGFKVFCSTVRAYNEVWWYYCSTDDTEVDSYVAYNTVERTWHIGNKSRTSAIDTSVVLAYPTATKANGQINAEEIGDTDNEVDITYTLETSDIEVNDAQIYLHAKKIIPDYDRITGTHNVSIETRGYPQRTNRTQGPFSVTGTTEQISVRARGSLLRFLFSGGDDFRLGRWRYRVTGKGRKHG